MSSSKSVSLFSVAVIFGGFALFLLLIYFTYLPTRGAGAHQVAAENLPESEQWRASTQSRKEVLATHRQEQANRATSYGWVDQAKGVVHLPIERAMALTVEEIKTARAQK